MRIRNGKLEFLELENRYPVKPRTHKTLLNCVKAIFQNKYCFIQVSFFFLNLNNELFFISKKFFND
jgi:hypothetical protein